MTAGQPKPPSPSVDAATGLAGVPLAAAAADRVDLSAYRPASSFDEVVDATGQIRSTNQQVIEAFCQMGGKRLNDMTEESDRLVRRSDANFVTAAEPISYPSRPWQLGVPPLALAASQWSALETGLVQRTRLLEAVLGDLFGDQTLIRDGVVPASLLPQCPSFYRAYRELGSKKNPDDASPSRMLLTATNLSRQSDGSWCVSDDRTRAPSGLGFAIENRVLVNRVLPENIDRSRVIRLAGFFMRLREQLQRVATSADPATRVVILTPGPLHYRYSEDAYLARYLNLTLVQGNDLTVRRGRLHLKTLAGLKPIDGVWRHIDDADCDPLELDPLSNRGATGMLDAIRHGRLGIANDVGSVVAELPALRPYLPEACRHLFAEDLAIRQNEILWLGDAASRQRIGLDQTGSISGASDWTDWAYIPAMQVSGDSPVHPTAMSAEERSEFANRLREQPQLWCARRDSHRGSTPVWFGSEMQSWFYSLRTFQLQTASGVDVMPGGLTRVSPIATDLDYGPRQGRFGLDTWVVSDAPVQREVSLLSDGKTAIRLRRVGDELPSRVAEELFWLARTLERIDFTSRLIRVSLRHARDQGYLTNRDRPRNDIVLRRLVTGLAMIGHLSPDHAIEGFQWSLPDLPHTLSASVTDSAQSLGLAATVASLSRRAVAVRDRISTDAYATLMNLVELFRESAATHPAGTASSERGVELATAAISTATTFAGLTSEMMTRTQGWRFVDLGRRIERGYQTAQWLEVALGLSEKDSDTDHSTRHAEILEALLRTTDSVMTYRSRYLMTLDVVAVLDLLIADPTNPRSIAFQLESIERELPNLPTRSTPVSLSTQRRISQNLRHKLRMVQPSRLVRRDAESGGWRADESLNELLKMVCEKLPKLSDVLTARYFVHADARRDWLGGDRWGESMSAGGG